MGAGVSASRRAAPAQPQPLARQVSPAAGVAVVGQPPANPQHGRVVYGVFSGGRTARKHLETAVTTLVADLSAANAKCSMLERDLQEERYEREQQGVPHTECVVCMAASVSTVLVPCGHLCLCVNCADSIKKSTKNCYCPLCRVEVSAMHRVFLPVEEAPLKSLKQLQGVAVDEKENKHPPSSPTASASDAASTPNAADAGTQVSPARRTPGSATRSASALVVGRGQPMHPAPRVYKREDLHRGRMTPRGLHVQLHAYDDDIIMRPSSIPREPMSYSQATRAQVEAERHEVAEVRGTPEERPNAFDFVLPGAFVPDRNPAFAATWDGALRVRVTE